MNPVMKNTLLPVAIDTIVVNIDIVEMNVPSHWYIIFNDLLIAANRETEHDVFCRMVLKRARRYNAKFNREKLQFKVEMVKYVGLQIASNGIQHDPVKVSTVVNMATPTNVKAV